MDNFLGNKYILYIYMKFYLLRKVHRLWTNIRFSYLIFLLLLLYYSLVYVTCTYIIIPKGNRSNTVCEILHHHHHHYFFSFFFLFIQKIRTWKIRLLISSNLNLLFYSTYIINIYILLQNQIAAEFCKTLICIFIFLDEIRI